MVMRKHSYFKNILIGIDQGLGTLFGIPADFTISGWVGFRYPGTWMERWLDAVFGKNHCQESREYDEERYYNGLR